jgi:CRISPR-associated endonuclease Csn1
MIVANLAFGIDLGIGSCGWAVIETPPSNNVSGSIPAIGSWIFDVPETDKERTPTNQIRRGSRLLRRVIRRRRNRMAELRRLFREVGLLSTDAPDALKLKGLDPWELRARGLDRLLTANEFAVALGHIAKRRGFKSAAKNKAANTNSDDKKMLAALEKTQERLGRYRTVGEMFARDPEFSGRKRNRDGMYDRTASRDDLAYEVKVLFAAQRRLGHDKAGEALETSYVSIAFRQKAMQDSERLVGMCSFEPTEKRAAKLSPSFEKFRLLQRLVNLRVTDPEGERGLRPDELKRATADLGKTKSLTVAKVRELIGLPDDQRFTTIKPDQEKDEITSKKGECLPGTGALRKALGEQLWGGMELEQLDQIAHVLSFFEDSKAIEKQLRTLGLSDAVFGALITALDTGKFASFKGAGGFSAKAIRLLLPHLEAGMRFDQACDHVGYDHTATKWTGREQITTKAQFNKLVEDTIAEIANPIARKAMTEGLKQLWAMRNKYGLPGAIHIELARDVGNSLEKRREIEKGINDATVQRKRERQEAREQLGVEDISGDTLLRYRLWKEQGGFCLYTGKAIPPGQFMSNDYQVDHILPWSRFGDDSYNNKTLCLISANQRKKGATPFEWFARDKKTDEWDAFVERVESNKSLRGYKKRNYLLKNAKEVEDKFRSRNLNDTRYACRLLAEAVKLFYSYGERQEKGGNRRVFTRPGQLTAALRTAWGLESLKKVDGKRLPDDRHHALDALVVAAVTEGEVQKLTNSFQEWEQQGLGRPLRRVDEPWEGFREQAKAAFESVFVARPERRRARGEGHAATIRQIVECDDTKLTSERVAVLSLGISKGKFDEAKALKQLDTVKDPERNSNIVNSIRAWIADGRPTEESKLPRSPQGDVITKIRLMSSTKPAVLVRGGTADRGEMVRVDVFSLKVMKGKNAGQDQWYLVPIYPHQVMDKKGWPSPPMMAVSAYKDEQEWSPITPDHEFRFSIYPKSIIEIAKPDGQVLEGFFQGMDRLTGAISLGNNKNPRLFADDQGNSMRGIGAKTLLTINKYNVDRFGNRFKVEKEVRTWHGVVCTSPSPPG